MGIVGMSAKVQDITGRLGTGRTAEVGIKISLKAFAVVPCMNILPNVLLLAFNPLNHEVTF